MLEEIVFPIALILSQVPTKNEEEEKRKAEEAAKKAKEAKKSEGGLIGFLMESVGATGNADKGGLDFSLANLCRCMCFTHEDTAASDSKVRLLLSLRDIYFDIYKIDHQRLIRKFLTLFVLDSTCENSCLVGGR